MAQPSSTGFSGHRGHTPHHSHQLSINSVNSVGSIIEPVTPPHSSTSQILGSDIDKDYLSSINKMPLAQLKPEILKLSKDQYGCRFLQKKIDENLISNYAVRYANFEIIFQEIHVNMYELIIDPFGNYLIQKLIKYCSNENLNLILEILQSNLFQIAINQHGTRALQKIIENLNTPYQLNLLIAGLKPFIIELIKDLNGNHVIQKILNKFQPVQCQFIYDSILNDLVTVATHRHGCCVLQKCLNHVTSFQLNQFINEILNDYNFNRLINDQFGNYVLQYLISINNYKINFKFYSNLVKFNLINYCNLKFSSNVIEKFIKNCANNEFSKNEININFVNLKLELMFQILNNPNHLNKVINDPFGNYVVQTLIDNLINSNINYHNLKPKSLYLLVNPIPNTNEQIRFEIIKFWFKNCKIVSSFGKRIQAKINVILNNNVNMNSNSDFLNKFDVPAINLQNNIGGVPSNQQPSLPVNNINFASGGTAMPSSALAASASLNSIAHNNVPIVASTPNLSPNPISSRSNSFSNAHSRSSSLQLTPTYVGTNPLNTLNNNYICDNPGTAFAYQSNYNMNINSQNLNQQNLNYNLKTPQIFSNAPFNDFIHDSNQKINYFR